MDIITRSEAIAQGRKRYRTGRKCRQGHIADRYVNGHGCVECRRERAVDPLLRDQRNKQHRARYRGDAAYRARKIKQDRERRQDC